MKLKDQLKRHEGFVKNPYKDSVGKITIGYGRNLEDVGISASEAEYLLDNDIRKATVLFNRVFGDFGHLNQARKDVLINMIFNMGLNRVKRFKKTLYHVAHSHFDKAADEMLDSLWARQVKGRAKELSEQMRTGMYQNV